MPHVSAESPADEYDRRLAERRRWAVAEVRGWWLLWLGFHAAFVLLTGTAILVGPEALFAGVPLWLGSAIAASLAASPVLRCWDVLSVPLRLVGGLPAGVIFVEAALLGIALTVAILA